MSCKREHPLNGVSSRGLYLSKEKALPFAPLIPNEETIAAMKAARKGELIKDGSVKNLIESLNAGG